MKLLLLGITLLLALNFGSAYVPEEVSILISVTLQRATPSIGLEWNYTPPADVTCSTECVFDLFRCADPFDPTPDCWGQAIYTVDVTQGPGTYSYTDTNVQVWLNKYSLSTLLKFQFDLFLENYFLRKIILYESTT